MSTSVGRLDVRAPRVDRGLVVGSWQLVRRVGSGAWTEVYQARPVRSTSDAAGDYVVKLLRPEFRRDRLASSLLQREAFVARQVAHPHLTTVLAAELDESCCYLVAPYLAGVTLRQSLAGRDRLPVPHALWIARQAAEALAALHAAGWLHRDVNGGNLIIAPGGHTTLIDLGLACRLDDDPFNRQAVAGTPAYMAPETFQAKGRLTPAVDVYSLGVVLYELLIGTLPFADDDPLGLMTAHAEAAPPNVRTRLPHVPSRLARLVRRMLAKEPLRRPSTDELIATLADLEIETFTERLVA